MTSRRCTLIILAALTTAPAQAADLAKWGDETVTTDDLRRFAAANGPRGDAQLVNPGSRRQLLDQLIEIRLLAKAGVAAGADRDTAYQDLARDAANRTLASYYLERELGRRTDDAAIQAYFDANPLRYASKELQVLHLLAATEGEAAALLAATTKEGFETVLKRHTGGKNGPKGGDLGWFARGRMIPEFEAAAFATPAGTVHPRPVRTAFGWHVLKVVGVRGSDNVRLAEVRERVAEDLKTDARRALVETLATAAAVKVDETALRDLQIKK